ncbi:hypothetical protein FFLO_04515 [Filobasidium floriforme]|uniref:Xylanolytic transcriptional activator regulatory domain-containing protein n=1 Tax=Filobasidium floriforme TaxID=5210 RepID=A0A8K0NP57_9TREE|nr:hypothetical protein FFLO_04515 [Filobasidium floriforme]
MSKQKESGPIRIQRACDECRREIRCDGYQDKKRQVCTHCRDFELACNYLGSAAIKRTTPAGYTEALEKQIKLLSAEFQRLHPDLDLSHVVGPKLDRRSFDKQAFASRIKQIERSSTAAAHTPGNSKHASLPDIAISTNDDATPEDMVMPWESHSGGSEQDMSDQEEDALALEDDEKLMVEISHLDQIEGDPYRYLGRSSLPRLAIIGMARTAQNGVTQTRQRRNPAYWSATPWQRSVSHICVHPLDHSTWPPLDLAPRLLRAYFQNHNSLLPILAETSFIRDYEADRWKYDSTFARVCLMVFALSSIVVKDDERVLWSSANSSGHDRHHSAGWSYAGEAVRMGRGSSDIARLEDIQFEALMTSFLAQNGDTSAAWQHVGTGLRYAVDLGVHVRAAFIRFRNPVLFELHTRVFWVLTFWDRILSPFFGRPLVLSQNDFDVDRPTEIDDIYWRPLSLGQQPEAVISDIVGFNVLLDVTEVLASLQEKGKNLTAPGHRSASRAGQQAVYQAYDGLVARCYDRLAEIQGRLPSHLLWDEDPTSPWFLQRCSIHGIISYAQISIDSPYPDYTKHHEWAARPELRRRAVQAAMRGVDISLKQAQGEKINHLTWVPLTAFSCLLAAQIQSNMSGPIQDRERDGLDEAVDKCLDAFTMARRWCAGWGKIRDLFQGFTAAFRDSQAGPSNVSASSSTATIPPVYPSHHLADDPEMAFLLELAAFSNPTSFLQTEL